MPEAVAAPAVKEGWEAEWEKVQKEAKKEGRVVLYTTFGPDMRQVLSEALKKYGMALEAISGRAAELQERVLRERKAGIYNVDGMTGGLATFVPALKDEGVLVPLEPLLILPEVKDPKNWYKGQVPFTSKEGTTIAFEAYVDQGIHVNTDLVKTGDITSMRDLLDPRWKGKIIMNDPTSAGRGEQFMSVTALKLGEDYIRNLAKQDPLITRDQRQLVDWVARGKYAIATGARPEEYQTYKRAGAPIANLPLAEVSYLLGGAGFIVLIDRAPHPKAFRFFLNWLLSKEGQLTWQQVRNTQSARLDMPVDILIKEGNPVRQPDVDYFSTRSDAWEIESKPKLREIVHETFRPLVK